MKGRMIIPLVVGAAALTFVGRVRKGEQLRPRLFLGALIVAIGLSVISDFAPKVANGLAVIIFMTAAAIAGPDAVVKGVNPANADRLSPGQALGPNGVPLEDKRLVPGQRDKEE